jgi:hypothetical protein
MNNIRICSHIRRICRIAYHILKNRRGCEFGAGIIHTIYTPSSRRRNACTVQVALIQNKWVEDIVGALPPLAALECVQLWLCIVESDGSRNAEGEDVFT